MTLDTSGVGLSQWHRPHLSSDYSCGSTWSADDGGNTSRHRPREPDEKHQHLYLDGEVAEPETLYDTYKNRALAAEAATMRVGVHMTAADVKAKINYDLPEMELRKWAHQRYIKDYLRVIAGVDDNVGRVLDLPGQGGPD